MATNPYVPASAFGNGSQVDFTFTFPYLSPLHVKVTLNGVATTAFTFLSANVLRFTVAPGNGVAVVITRETPGDTLSTVIQPGGALPVDGLNANFLQSLYYNQETEFSSSNQSTAGLQAQIDDLEVVANSASANAGAAISTANTADATASGLAASIATANSTAGTALSTANSATTTANSATTTANNAATAASANVGRNRIINGSFLIDQRTSGVARTITAGAALSYTADRWYAYCTGANVTGQRITVSGAQPDPNRYQFTGAASTTLIGLGQRVEAANCRDLAGTTATLSVSLSNSLLTTVNWQAFYANTSDTFGTLASPTRTSIASGSFTVNGTYSRYSTQLTIPAAATTGIEVVFTVGAQTSGTWVIGSAQLEPGSVVTPFAIRSAGLELSLCQRYSWHGLPCGALNFPSFATSSVASWIVSFPVAMRVTPTLSINLSGSTYNNCGSADFDQPGRSSARFVLVSTALTTNSNILFGASDIFSASAEL